MKNHQLLKKILGSILIIIGTIGLFIPLLQGILFIITGIALISGKKLAEKFKLFLNKIKNFFLRLF